jgi:hypothetical protein
MKQVWKIDTDGFYLEPVKIQDDEELTEDLIDIEPPQGAHKARFDGEKWVETVPQDEIDAQLNPPIEKTEIDILKEENAQLTLDIINLWETLLVSGVIQ